MFKMSGFSIFLLFIAPVGKTQIIWTLQDCIDYAIKNNVSVKEADVQRRLSALGVESAKGALWPSLAFSGSSGYRFGLSENPTTGILQSSNFFSSGFSLSAGVTLFNWFAKTHNLKAAQASAEAGALDVKKAQDDVTLQINAAYLQALLAKELLATATIQVQQTAIQAEATRKKINVGILSELDAAQIRQQQLTDSLLLLAANETYDKALLQLKAIIALDAKTVIKLQAVPSDDAAIARLLTLTPEVLFASAVKNLPGAKNFQLQSEAASERIKAIKANRYPTLSLYGMAGSNFVNIPSAQGFVYLPQQPTGSKVFVNGTSYDVVAPSYSVSNYGITPFFRQLHKNFGQTIGISISFPILNGKSLALNQKREELNASLLRLQNDRFLQNLKTQVYSDYMDALNAYKKFLLLKRLVTEATIVFDAAEKRYALNLLSTQDLLLAQNTLQKTKTDLLLVQYDLGFKIRLLAFYDTLH